MIKTKQEDAINLIKILDNNDSYTESKIDNIKGLSEQELDNLLVDIKALSDYYVKSKLLRITIPFSIDIDVINGVPYITLYDVFSKVIIPKLLHPLRISVKLINNLKHKGSMHEVIIDLTNLHSVDFNKAFVEYSFLPLITNETIKLNNNELYDLENTIVNYINCDKYLLGELLYSIIKYHIKHISCNDTQVHQNLKDIEILLQQSSELNKLRLASIVLIDNLHKWSLKHNVR